jgi:hypothetical protein
MFRVLNMFFKILTVHIVDMTRIFNENDQEFQKHPSFVIVIISERLRRSKIVHDFDGNLHL